MKGWEPKRHWRKRERLLAVIRWLHWMKVRDGEVTGKALGEELKIIDSLNKRLYQTKVTAP